MNKQLREVKKLAEQHFYRGRKLTEQERFLVENSPFADVLSTDKSNFKFYQVLEQYGKESGIDAINPGEPTRTVEKPYKPRYLNISINRQYLGELIDDVEEKFNLGVFNKSMYKFDSVDLNELKHFIDDHCAKNIINKSHPGTCKELSDITRAATDVHDLLYKLYTLRR